MIYISIKSYILAFQDSNRMIHILLDLVFQCSLKRICHLTKNAHRKKIATLKGVRSVQYSLFNPFPHTAILHQTTFRKTLNVHSAERNEHFFGQSWTALKTL